VIKPTGLCHPKQKTKQVEMDFDFDKSHCSRDEAPADHDATDSDAGSHTMQQDIARDLEEKITDKKDPCTLT
jgi:hypothetical protein